jgi:hypothetical protein
VNLDDQVKSKIVKACALRKKRAFMRTRVKTAPSPDVPQQGDLLD